MKYLTAAEVAERWQCSEETVTRLARRRTIQALRIGRVWRFPFAHVEAYEAAHTVGPEATSATGAPRVRERASTSAAVALDGAYAPVVKGPVPWRTSVIQ